MNRLTHATRAVDLFGAGKDGYQDSPATVLNSVAMNAVQEEIARAIEAFGITLNGASYVQLATVLTTLLNAAGGSTTLQQSSSTPVFATNKKAHDHPSSASNKWKYILEMPIAASLWVRIYAGDDTAAPGGAWAITYNAVWDPASGAQSWSKDDNAKVSLALICDSVGLNWRQRAAGAGSFTTWTSATGDLNVGGNIVAGAELTTGSHINSGASIYTGTGGQVVSDTFVTAGADLIAIDDVIAGDKFQYQSAKSRTKAISPVGSGADGITEGEYAILPAAASTIYAIPHAPDGGTLGAVRIKFHNTGGDADYSVKLKKRTAPNWVGGTVTHSTVDSATGTASGVTNETTLSYGGLTIDNNETYEMWVQCSAGPGSLLINAIEYDYTELGPGLF